MNPLTEKSTTWERVGAALYEPFLARGERLGMRQRRAEVIARARGDVLEIGAGTGLNVEHYPDTIRSLVLTEPVSAMAARLRRRAAGRDAVVVEAPAERLPFPDASFDTVTSTMVLCTVDDVDAALAEIARVLTEDGTLLFVEHVHAGDTRLGRRQARWAGLWAGFAQGCRCDRDLVAAIRARFDVPEITSGRWNGMPTVVRPLVSGAATPSPRLRECPARSSTSATSRWTVARSRTPPPGTARP